MGIPFQREMCHIRKTEGRNLMASDEVLLITMRRENMDVC